MPLLPYRLIVQALSDHNIQRLQQGRTTCLTILGAEPENLKCLDLMGKSNIKWTSRKQRQPGLKKRCGLRRPMPSYTITMRKV